MASEEPPLTSSGSFQYLSSQDFQGLSDEEPYQEDSAQDIEAYFRLHLQEFRTHFGQEGSGVRFSHLCEVYLCNASVHFSSPFFAFFVTIAVLVILAVQWIGSNFCWING